MQLGFDFGSPLCVGKAPARADAPGSKTARSNPGLSFLRPAPKAPARPPEAPEEAGAGANNVLRLTTPPRAPEAAEEPARPSSRGRKLPPEVLNETEIRKLIGACSRRATTGYRNRALIALLWRAGLRISEAIKLRPHDLDFDHGTVRVRAGKGSKPRTAVLSDLDALDLVREWLTYRALVVSSDHDAALFCSLEGTELDPSYLRHLLPRLARRAGVSRRIHCHALRHTHASELARRGVPEVYIQRQLGHQNLSTTSRYLERVGAPAELLSKIRPSCRSW